MRREIKCLIGKFVTKCVSDKQEEFSRGGEDQRQVQRNILPPAESSTAVRPSIQPRPGIRAHPVKRTPGSFVFVTSRNSFFKYGNEICSMNVCMYVCLFKLECYDEDHAVAQNVGQECKADIIGLNHRACLSFTQVIFFFYVL